MSDARIVDADATSHDARWAMTQYFDELEQRFPAGFDPGDAVTAAADEYAPPRGRFLLAVADDVAHPLACGAVTHLDDAISEIKRMWVHPEARGQGLGRRLLEALEAEAIATGRRRVVLDTNGVLLEAIAMYEAAGYEAIERYNDNPYAERWFGKDLPPG